MLKISQIGLIFSLLLLNSAIGKTSNVDTVKQAPFQVKSYEWSTDDPILAQLDSLHSLKFLDNPQFSENTVLDTLFPIVTDTLRMQLAKLSGHTPFDLTYNERVEAFINLYVNKRRELSGKMLGLSEYYFPMFEEILDAHDMPLEIKYLAMVESALNPTARSRAGASGLWQFMYSTGRMFNLKVTSFIDDRHDPLKSTEAACKYLKHLHGMYDDWNLALAAYNCGPGNVNKAIRRSGGKRNYWEIYRFLPRETRGYVPAFIAVNYLAEHAEEYGIFPTKIETSFFATDTVHVDYLLTFKQVAERANITEEQLKFLNPQFRFGIIPDDGQVHVLRMPIHVVGDFVTNEAVLKEEMAEKSKNSEELLAENEVVDFYTVRSGDYLGKIATRYGCSVRQLMEWNGLRSSRLRVGQRLTVYVSPSYKPKSTSAKTIKKENFTEKDGYLYYEVQSGDTLWDIAKSKGISADQLKALNQHMNPKNLKPGDKIIVGKEG